MKFGLLFETQRPFQGTDIDWNLLYKETLDQCELADQVGFDNLWFVEHHFLTGFSGSPSQDAIFGALSRITKQIRIGYGVCILPYHHPVRVAERVALVDQLTDGRVEFLTPMSRWAWALIPAILVPCGKNQLRCCLKSGSRRSSLGKVNTGMYRRAEYCPNPSRNPIPGCIWLVPRRRVSAWLPIDPRNTRSLWEESIAMLPQIWQSEEFSWEGEHWNVPPRRVLPKPFQKPHPRMYLACTQTESFRLAAERPAKGYRRTVLGLLRYLGVGRARQGLSGCGGERQPDRGFRQ